VPADLAARLARCARAGDLLGAEQEDGLDGLAADLIDDGVDGEPGIGDEFDQGGAETARWPE